jgi:hypothetical protein
MQQDHGFSATPKMHKTELASWDVRKYMTKKEMEAAGQIIKLKQVSGEYEPIMIRGKERNPNVLLRHMRKSGARRNQRLSSQTLSQENKLRGVLGVVQPRPQYLNIEFPMYPAGPERIIETICKETTYMVLAARGDVYLRRTVHAHDYSSQTTGKQQTSRRLNHT